MMKSVDALILLCRRLVQVESLSGQEGEVAALITQQMADLQFDEAWIDRTGNVIGRIKGTGAGQTVLFTGHMDCSPAVDRESWAHDPLAADVTEGRIYGLGISDMKGSIAAMIYGIAQLKAAERLLHGDIYTAFTVSELTAPGAAMQEVIEQIKPDIIVLGEPTGLNLAIGQRGRAEIEVISPAHPLKEQDEQGADHAITQMMLFLEHMLRLERRIDDQLGRGTSIITSISSISYPIQSVKPDHCKVMIDRRLLAYDIEQQVLDEYRQLCSEVNISLMEHTHLSYTGTVLNSRSYYPAWLLDSNDDVVQSAICALHEQGIPAELMCYHHHTHGSYAGGIAEIRAIGFGPSVEQMTPIVDDYIEIDQLIKAAEGYYALAKTLAVQPRRQINR